MNTLRKALTLIALISMVQSCGFFRQEEAEPLRYNEPRFTSEQPIQLNVNRIEIVSEFTPSFRRPNVEHLLPISLEKTAKQWAKDRLDAVGYSSDKVAKFIIKDASVTEEKEDSERAFYKDSLIYKAKLNVVLEISDPKNISRAETQITAWRELKIPADTSIADKEKYWNNMVNKIFDEFNVNMEKQIHQYLNMYIRNNSHVQEY